MSRGGMAINPFGGRTRLDVLDLRPFRTGNSSAESFLYLETIRDAVFIYLGFGLGRNGTTPDEFWWASEYLFRIRSDQPETWQHARIMREVAEDARGKWANRVVKLSDVELQTMCFDRHFELAGISQHMEMSKFLDRLKEERRKVVRDNRRQIMDYLGREIHPEWREALSPLDPMLDDCLVAPSGQDLAFLIFPPAWMKTWVESVPEAGLVSYQICREPAPVFRL